jgi:mono/diheme cytochrome c family protein
MTTTTHPCLPLLAATALAATLLSASPARADERARRPAAVPAAYAQECGSCHVAYPPRLLPATSWQRLMAGLDTHFGSDAALDAATAQQLSQWLRAHAADSRKRRAEPPQDRITRTDWFVREHRHVDGAAWTHPGVKSAANCAACHPRAEHGVFDDDELRTPPGLDSKLTRVRRD